MDRSPHRASALAGIGIARLTDASPGIAQSVTVKRERSLATLIAGGIIAMAIVSLWPSSTTDPTYNMTRCHLVNPGQGRATYVALPPVTPTPALPDYQAPRWVGDTRPCGV